MERMERGTETDWAVFLSENERRIHKCNGKGIDTEDNEKNMSSLQMLKGEEFPTRRLILTKSPLG